MLIANIHEFYSVFACRYTRISDAKRKKNTKRNTLNCGQSNYSSRIVLFYIPIEFAENVIEIDRNRNVVFDFGV